jgi:hypothetical protein
MILKLTIEPVLTTGSAHFGAGAATIAPLAGDLGYGRSRRTWC